MSVAVVQESPVCVYAKIVADALGRTDLYVLLFFFNAFTVFLSNVSIVP